MTEPVLDLAGVEKTYRFFRLSDVALRLEAGQIMGFVGPNGAGKSTTIRIVMGMVRHDRGTVRVLGHAIPEMQAEAKRDVGFVSEDMRLSTQLSLDWHTIPFLVLPVPVYLFFGVMLAGPAVAKNPAVANYLFSGFSVFAVMGPALFGAACVLAVERDAGLLKLKRALPAQRARI